MTVDVTAYDENAGGFEAAQMGLTAVVTEGEPEALDLGDDAVVVVGPTLGGSNVTGGGLLHLGPNLLQVTLLPGPDVPDEDIRQLTVDVLTLLDAKV